ncbi:hypothetical protein B0H14DRAFT_2583949 [Mycena olivaceomarginata]|nr:hypothetical protein B0H14DRAFT_2583949 [Mycena olivaceomarginata]
MWLQREDTLGRLCSHGGQEEKNDHSHKTLRNKTYMEGSAHSYSASVTCFTVELRDPILETDDLHCRDVDDFRRVDVGGEVDKEVAEQKEDVEVTDAQNSLCGTPHFFSGCICLSMCIGAGIVTAQLNEGRVKGETLVAGGAVVGVLRRREILYLKAFFADGRQIARSQKRSSPHWPPTPQEIAAFCVCAVRLLRVVSLDSRVQGARKDGRKGVKFIDISGKKAFIGVGWEKEFCPRGSYFSGFVVRPPHKT